MSITTTTIYYAREKGNKGKERQSDYCNNELQKLLNRNKFYKSADIIHKRQRKARQQQHHRHQSKVSLLSQTVKTEAIKGEFCVNDTNSDIVVRQYKSQDSNENVANVLHYDFCAKNSKMPLFTTTTIISPLLICEQRQQHSSTPALSQKLSSPTKMQKQYSSTAPSICCANSGFKYNQRSTYSAKYCCPILLIYNTTFICSSILLQTRFLQLFIILLLSLSRMITFSNALLVVEPTFIGLSSDGGVGIVNENGEHVIYNNTRTNVIKTGIGGAADGGVAVTATGSSGVSGTEISTISAVLDGGGTSGGSSVGSAVAASDYLDKLDHLERSVAAVLIKVAYGTTSTTKRSIPDNSNVPSLTTMATPLLTTLRYIEKSPHQQQINLHHRNYELDLERDHALPTSAPNADILKSNSNPTYPNPNRHHNHDRERHHHLLNSTPLPSLSSLLKKNKGQSPTISMYPGDIPSYSPPARSFFTPPLPPEYQNPFADKPTLRGTNNEGIIANTGTYINRRPIPPPSLMPGHERIPFRPPDLAASTGGKSYGQQVTAGGSNAVPIHPGIPSSSNSESERKKVLNTPSRTNVSAPLQNIENKNYYDSNDNISQGETIFHSSPQHNTRQEVLPSIRRILSGSNGNKGEIPEVLLKQATSHPIASYRQPPASPVVIIDNTSQQKEGEYSGLVSPNINKSKNMNGGEKVEYEGGGILDITNGGNVSKTKTKMSTISTYTHDQHESNNGISDSGGSISSTPSAAAAISEAGAAAAAAAATSTSSTVNSTDANNSEFSSSSPSSSSSSTAAAAATHATWTIAWNIHVYLSVILFTILAVYSLYKMFTYNKLTHLFSQSYFVCIHLILIIICASRIFYLCYDAYNIHSSFHIFFSAILLNLPATFLTISFSVLILFLFLKSLNHKNNRYSALIRPLTVVVGCGVHVVLCITLHYVESYTMQNQHYYYQQQHLYRRQHQNHKMNNLYTPSNSLTSAMDDSGLHLIAAAGSVPNAPPPRVLSLICQIIYIFICLSLGILYLYLYRILKRILRSKSQNYIHGYQNLSYAIHITIATALLFVLLAALQIFGAISISTTRPLIAQVTVEIDWLQWGYQFSLRLIEIAIITLLSWVAGLKTNGGSGTVGIGNGDSHLVVGVGGGVFGSGGGAGGREKHGHHNHSNVAGFFLPCTSSSSQEQFDTDYPAVCNANTNLHTYTMRTGKLIYDDSLALNSLASGAGQSLQMGSSVGGRNSELQLQQQLTYQRPYDTGSLHSSANHNAADYSAQGAMGNRYNHDIHQYADYLTDATTDHYENPNFDLRGSCVENSAMQKFTKTSTTSTTVSSSGGSGSSAASQQQKLLLQSDSCYSEPLQPNCNLLSNYEFNNFELPKLNVGTGTNNDQLALECWSVPNSQPITGIGDKRDTKSHTTLERSAYENPERRSSNSTYSCASTSGGCGRYTSYNSFERGHYNGVRKSGTLNNIVGGSNSIMHSRNSSSSSAASSNVSTAAQRASGVQTLALFDRYHHAQQQYHSNRGSKRVITRGSGIVGAGGGSTVVHEHGRVFGLLSLDRANSPITQQEQQQHSHDDIMLSDSNVERTNLINNEDGSCITNSIKFERSAHVKDLDIGKNSTISSEILKISKGAQSQINSHSNVDGNQIPNHYQFEIITPDPDLGSPINSNSGASSSVSESATSGSMLVAEHGFVRFRALDDINNAQGVGIHNASIRNQNRNNAAIVTS